MDSHAAVDPAPYFYVLKARTRRVLYPRGLPPKIKKQKIFAFSV
jgi:hypothetical protein